MSDPKRALKTVECPNCEKKVPQTTFCIVCGKKLDVIPSKKAKPHFSMVICPICKQNVPETEFCIRCGNKIEVSSMREVTQVIESETPSSTTSCPLCRENVPFEHNFCHLCGGRIKKEDKDHLPSIICNRCWKPNPTNTDYCIHCGAISLGKHTFQVKLLDEPFEGYQLDLSQFFQPTTVPLSAFRHGTSKNFPIRSTIMHSAYFGVKIQRTKQNFVSRNFGGFDRKNLLNYIGTFALLLIIYVFWYSSRYIGLTGRIDIITEGFLALVAITFLTFLLMSPIWLSTFLVFRNTGYRLNFKLDSSKIFITIIFNMLWILFGYGPILLRMGEFKDVDQRIINQRPFVKGIVWGAVITIFFSTILGLLTLTVVGIPGLFAGFLFQNHPIKGHILASYFGATWIALILLLPLGEYFDRVIKQWNVIGYLILLTIGFLLLTHSFNLIGFLTQRISRV